jgi:hypothetical protein
MESESESTTLGDSLQQLATGTTVRLGRDVSGGLCAGQTLLLVKRMHWIVAEDSSVCSPLGKPTTFSFLVQPSTRKTTG